MQRPHIEFVQRQALPWEDAELAPGAPSVRRKVLSCNPAFTAFTTLLRLEAGWNQKRLPPHAGACELFLLRGCLHMQTGEEHFELNPGGYLRFDSHQLCGAISAIAATELLYMTAIGAEPANAAALEKALPDFTFIDSETLDWQTPWVLGPNPGLKIKLLWRSEDSGAYTRLIRAEPGWTEERQEHHDCIEEVYLLSGDMTMGKLGTMTAGGYIWRPAGIKHGPMRTRKGGLMFIRTDGPLKNYYTDVDGTPLNY